MKTSIFKSFDFNAVGGAEIFQERAWPGTRHHFECVHLCVSLHSDRCMWMFNLKLSAVEFMVISHFQGLLRPLWLAGGTLNSSDTGSSFAKQWFGFLLFLTNTTISQNSLQVIRCSSLPILLIFAAYLPDRCWGDNEQKQGEATPSILAVFLQSPQIPYILQPFCLLRYLF